MGSGTKRTGASIISIQYLRAIAALLVVFYHAIYQIKEYHSLFEGGIWRFGAAGVDIFFVISGFIMWVTTSGRPADPLRFIGRRITRIVPLYWIVTMLTSVAILLRPRFFYDHVLNVMNFFGSLAFVPVLRRRATPLRRR